MLTGCPKCPVFCLSEGIRIYHLCRWGFQDFIICPGFTCMNWLPALGRCNNKKNGRMGISQGIAHAQIRCCCSRWLKARRWGSQDFIICLGFTCMNWLPGLGRCNNKKKGRMGILQGIAHGSNNRMLWLKMAQGSAVRVSRFYHLSWFHLHELTPRLGALQQQKKRVGWVFYRASPMAQIIGCCGSRWLRARRWGSQDFIISVGEGCQILSSLGGRRGTCVTGSSFLRSVFETWSDFGWDSGWLGWNGWKGWAGACLSKIVN